MGMNYYSSLAFHWLDNIPGPTGLPEWPEQDPRAHTGAGRAAGRRGLGVIGDPDDCARGCSVGRLGFDQLTFSPTTNTLPTDVVIGSMELFGKRGHPAVRQGPGALHHPLPPRGGGAGRPVLPRLTP
jgi:hypothetical protein